MDTLQPQRSPLTVKTLHIQPFSIHMTSQTYPVAGHAKAAVKATGVRIDSPAAFFNGGMTFQADGVRAVVMTARAGENFPPGDASVEIGIGRIGTETEAQGMRIGGQIGS